MIQLLLFSQCSMLFLSLSFFSSKTHIQQTQHTQHFSSYLLHSFPRTLPRQPLPLLIHLQQPMHVSFWRSKPVTVKIGISNFKLQTMQQQVQAVDGVARPWGSWKSRFQLLHCCYSMHVSHYKDSLKLEFPISACHLSIVKLC